jgi:hypothetical protein
LYINVFYRWCCNIATKNSGFALEIAGKDYGLTVRRYAGFVNKNPSKKGISLKK